MKSFSFLGCRRTQNGKATLKIYDREGFDASLREFGDGEDLQLTLEEVGAEQARTRQQEKGFHAMIRPWAKDLGYSVDELKDALLGRIFGMREQVNPLTGDVEMVLRKPHTSKLTKTEYNELIEGTMQTAAEMNPPYLLEAPSEYRTRKLREQAPLKVSA